MRSAINKLEMRLREIMIIPLAGFAAGSQECMASTHTYKFRLKLYSIIMCSHTEKGLGESRQVWPNS